MPDGRRTHVGQGVAGTQLATSSGPLRDATCSRWACVWYLRDKQSGSSFCTREGRRCASSMRTHVRVRGDLLSGFSSFVLVRRHGAPGYTALSAWELRSTFRWPQNKVASSAPQLAVARFCVTPSAELAPQRRVAVTLRCWRGLAAWTVM